MRDLLRQIASLKSRLENTEATQKDFIQLAQSLQVRSYTSLTTQNGLHDPINAHPAPTSPCFRAHIDFNVQVRLAEIEEERQANMASSPEHAPL